MSLCFSSPCALADASYVWIKDSKTDGSNWPAGFSQLPQPAHDTDVDVIDGSSETALDTAFDALMRKKAGPFTSVFLGPGLFKTRGIVGNIFAQSDSPGFRLQTHSRLIGSGKGGVTAHGTTLRLVGVNENAGAVVVGSNEFDTWSDDGFTYTTASDIWVTDLEIDCNGPELSKVPGSNPPVLDTSRQWYIQGVQLWGTNACHIERVHVKNAIEADTVPPVTEDFILCINSPPGVSLDNVIAECSVTDFYNPTGLGACSAISMNRWDQNAGSIQGVIRDCEVVLNGDRGWGFGGEFAYNASSAWGLVITNCTARGAERGFNNDTFPNYRLSVAGNRFDMPAGICSGFVLVKGNPWSRFYRNTVILHGPGASGFLIDRAIPAGDNLILDNNTVQSVGTNWGDVSWSYNLNDNFNPNLVPSGVHLEHNSVLSMATAPLNTLVPGSVGYMARNSVNGADWLWPVLQPHLGWTYTSARADFLQDGTVDVLLQDPAGYLYAYSLLGNKAQSPTALVPNQPLPQGWQVVGTGDLNLDGRTDLFLNHPDFGLGFWLLDGNTCLDAGTITFQGTPCLLDGGWKVVAVTDFNGDGKPDLLLQDDNTYLGIWHLDGAQVIDIKLLSRNYAGVDPSFAPGSTLVESVGRWRAVGTGDFNGDGKADILFQYDLPGDALNDGQLAVWYMDDFTLLGTGLLDPVRPNDPNDRVVACGDFYRNCAIDIVFQKKAPRTRWGGPLTVWSMDPVARYRRVKEGTVALSSASLNVLAPR